MKRSVFVVLSLLFLFLAASPPLVPAGDEAGRRPRPSDGGPGLNRLGLLDSSLVREELGLSASQATAVTALSRSYRGARQKLRRALTRQDLPPEEKEESAESFQERHTALMDETNRRLGEILEPEQTLRLNQILLQHHGVPALLDDYAVKGLGLSAKQIEKLKDVIAWERDERIVMMEQLRERLRERPRTSRGFPEGQREAFVMLREESRKKALDILSDDQKKRLETLRGKPFELDPRSFLRGKTRRVLQPGGSAK